MPRNIAGPVVQGDDLFGRDSFIQQVEAALPHGSVLVSAPRRWGKTSVLQRLVERDASTRYYFDLYPLTRASDLVAEIAAATANREERARSWVGELLGRTLGQIREIRLFELAVELRERLAQDPSWEQAGRRALAALQDGTVLVLDEFPVLVKAILDREPAEASSLLHWLRSERQRPGRGPVFVFAGSTSLQELCWRSGLSATINDLQSLPLPRYDDALARSLLTQVFAAEGLKVSGAVLETIIDLVGPEVPFFLQLMAAAIIREHGPGALHPPGVPPAAAPSRGSRVTPAAVRSLYEQVLLGSENRAYLDDYRSRMARSYLPAEENVAIVVLSALSKDRAGLDIARLRNEVIARHGDDALLERVLVLLEGDFYVVREQGERYRFFNRYLADWWRRFHA